MAVRSGFTLTTAVSAALLLSLTGVASGTDTGGGTNGGGDRGGGDGRSSGERSDGRHHGADYRLRASGQFGPAGANGKAITYDQRLVPRGAGIKVTQHADRDGMSVSVRVRGVAPDHTFGVHVHTGVCTADPDAAGPHYQNVRDPEPPSMDPEYANPRNEVWLDFTSDDDGTADSAAWHPWQFRLGEARSVVLHERATSSEPGEAGMAGERVACFTVPFTGAEAASGGA